jgi:hypothetical protein
LRYRTDIRFSSTYDYQVPSSNNTVAPAIRGELETLFDTLSDQAQELRFCKNCGLQMIYIDAMFFLAEGERSWNVPLPMCPKCSRAGLKVVVPRAA